MIIKEDLVHSTIDNLVINIIGKSDNINERGYRKEMKEQEQMSKKRNI